MWHLADVQVHEEDLYLEDHIGEALKYCEMGSEFSLTKSNERTTFKQVFVRRHSDQVKCSVLSRQRQNLWATVTVFFLSKVRVNAIAVVASEGPAPQRTLRPQRLSAQAPSTGSPTNILPGVFGLVKSRVPLYYRNSPSNRSYCSTVTSGPISNWCF